jgi:hypothetical protein
MRSYRTARESSPSPSEGEGEVRVEPSRLTRFFSALQRGEQARRLNKISLLGIFLFIAFFAVGCDRHASADSSAPTPMPYAENVPGDGTIIGNVTLAGSPQPTMPQTGGMPDESLVVASDGAVADAVVSVDGLPPSDGRNQPAVSLDQLNCMYVPHVVALQIRQPMLLSSHDPFPHNVDMLTNANPPENLSFPHAGSQTLSFNFNETFKVRCDIHPNMSAWVVVMPNAYFAVTGKDGTFTMRHVPAGACTLSAWHERLGTLQQPLLIKPGQTVHLNFVYQP